MPRLLDPYRYASTPSGLLTDLVAYWAMDETSGTSFSDSTGNGHTLTSDGTRTANASGKNNYCTYAPAGTAGKLSAPDSSLWDSAAFTISFWIKQLNADGNERGLVARTGGFYSYGWRIETLSGVIYFDFYGGSGTSNLTAGSSTNFGDGSWHNVIVTYDSATTSASIDVDGTTVASTTSMGTFASASGENLYLACVSPFSGFQAAFFDGYMDEVAFWSRALTSTERASVYNAGAGDFYPF